MNVWTEYSVKLASQENYLDRLYRVYPTIPNEVRELNTEVWEMIKKAYESKNSTDLIKALLSLDLFPVKDGYVAYLRKDKGAIERNPETINRLAGQVFSLSLDELFEKCSEPKETNRQMGQAFRRWLNKGEIGVPIIKNKVEFLEFEGNCILDGGDKELDDFAKEYLGYTANKGLDLIAKFNKKMIIGEAKFLTDFGGHQNAQLRDALFLLEGKFDKSEYTVERIAILDGVCYIEGGNKMFKEISEFDGTIMSALFLKDFLYQI
ncbi:MAG: restriction endonuclease [Candidatus Dojkabacteria bacterium]|jgi:hypothetical protein|nr:restriction endonuclease [Candidatus Dojkabacteria bacterium]MDD4561207.1 restriction endonuclease [Candidatus Dojkabacteria bacterium]MDY0097326.1 restriction endonuclease [Candidatus Dojkabacteria bacterium]